MSKEYALSIAIVLGSLLKLVGVELENNVLEGLILGVAALVIAIKRKARGDIDVLGRRV
jgi:hypothetical protein